MCTQAPLNWRGRAVLLVDEDLDLMSVAGTILNDADARNRVIERLKDRV